MIIYVGKRKIPYEHICERKGENHICERIANESSICSLTIIGSINKFIYACNQCLK